MAETRASSVYTTAEVDELLAQRDVRLDDHELRIEALEGGTVDPPDPPDPLPTPEGVDLLVDDVVLPGQLTAGQPATLGALVTNVGDTATPTGAVIGVGFLLDDAAVGAQVAWCSTDVGLAPGASVQLDTASAPMTSGPWVPTVDGLHQLTAHVDDLNRIPEYDDANNRLTVDVDIRAGQIAHAGQLFVPGSSWNTVKVPGAFASGADGWLSGATWGVNGGTWGHPMAFARNSDPTHTFAMPNSWGWPAGEQRFPMPDSAVPASGTDGHLCVINLDSGDLVDMWQLHKTGDRRWSCSAWARHNAKTGQGWGQASPFLSAGVTACGAPTGAGTITHDECIAARIDHALCFAADYGAQGGKGTCGTGLLYPAIHSDTFDGPGPLAESCLLLVTGTAPSGLNPVEQAIYRAASTYGLFCVDKLDGQPMLYVSDAADVGQIRPDKLTAILRQARMVKTWA